MDRNEQEVGAPMRTERPAPASPSRTASDRLHVLLCHACEGGDLHTLEEVVAHWWHAQAERLSLAGPARRWWPWRRAG